MNGAESDFYHVEVAKISYRPNLKVGDQVWAGDRLVGYVAELRDKVTGEQSQVITDIQLPANPTAADRARVRQVLVLYRGSSVNLDWDSYSDWALNDIPLGLQAIRNELSPRKLLFGIDGKTKPTTQLVSSAQTLNEVMDQYPNAMFDVYGHSLGSMDAQYALASVRDTSRLRNGYVYEGPNIYSSLDPTQRKTAAQIKDRVFNYIDDKDFVPMSPLLYRRGNAAVGTVIKVDSTQKSFGDQHMWGGYQFDESGTIKTNSYDLQAVRFGQLAGLAKAYCFYSPSGVISETQQLMLNILGTAALGKSLRMVTDQSLGQMIVRLTAAIATAAADWRNDLSIAEKVARHLDTSEHVTVMAQAGLTRDLVEWAPTDRCQHDIYLLTQLQTALFNQLDMLDRAVTQMVAADQQAANLWAGW